jgi:hypothetical protein
MCGVHSSLAVAQSCLTVPAVPLPLRIARHPKGRALTATLYRVGGLHFVVRVTPSPHAPLRAVSTRNRHRRFLGTHQDGCAYLHRSSCVPSPVEVSRDTAPTTTTTTAARPDLMMVTAISVMFAGFLRFNDRLSESHTRFDPWGTCLATLSDAFPSRLATYDHTSSEAKVSKNVGAITTPTGR